MRALTVFSLVGSATQRRVFMVFPPLSAACVVRDECGCASRIFACVVGHLSLFVCSFDTSVSFQDKLFPSTAKTFSLSVQANPYRARGSVLL